MVGTTLVAATLNFLKMLGSFWDSAADFLQCEKGQCLQPHPSFPSHGALQTCQGSRFSQALAPVLGQLQPLNTLIVGRCPLVAALPTLIRNLDMNMNVSKHGPTKESLSGRLKDAPRIRTMSTMSLTQCHKRETCTLCVINTGHSLGELASTGIHPSVRPSFSFHLVQTLANPSPHPCKIPSTPSATLITVCGCASSQNQICTTLQAATADYSTFCQCPDQALPGSWPAIQ